MPLPGSVTIVASCSLQAICRRDGWLSTLAHLRCVLNSNPASTLAAEFLWDLRS